MQTPLIIAGLFLLEAFQEHLINSPPQEVIGKLLQSMMDFMQIQIVPESGFTAGVWHTRLLRVNFPGVKVENTGLMLFPVNTIDRPPGETVGK
jgi:hypothetical protein